MSKKVLKRVQYSLMKPLRGKGGIGDFVFVKPGYGRYLEKYNKAARVTKELELELESKKSEWIKNEEKHIAFAKDLLAKIAQIELITLIKKVSQGTKLYAAVKKEDIIDFFIAKNISLEKEHLKIDNVIKTLGEHSIIINVYGNEEIEMKVNILQEE